MALTRRHGVTNGTYTRFAIDSGAIYRNYGEASQTLVGATSGGNTATIETEYREMEVDGARGPVKGGRRITRVDCTITANLIELSDAELFQRVMAGSDNTDSGAYHTISRELQIEDADYATNYAIVGEVSAGNATPCVIIVKNVINDGNLEWAFNDKEESVITMTLKAHFLPSTMDTEPWEIRWPDGL